MALSPQDFERLRQTLAAKKPDGFASNVSDALNTRGANLSTTLQSGMHPASKGLGILGQGAGFVGDVVGAGIKQIPFAEEAISAVAKPIVGSKPVQDAMAGYKSWKAQHPEAATNLESVVNIGSLIPVGKGAQIGAKTAVSGAGSTARGVSRTVAPVVKSAKSFGKDVIPNSQGVINHQVAKALDFAPSDLSNISKATGNEVGPWLANNNLIGVNRAETQTLVKGFFDKNYASVREEIAKVKTTYKPSQLPRYTDALLAIQKKVVGVPGLEKIGAQVENLLGKKEGIVLSDVQKVKELMDDHFDLYNVTGDVGESVAKQGLANIRSGLKQLIEKEVKKNTGFDISPMNKNVATAASINKAIETRAPKGLTRSNLKLGDLGIFGVGMSFGGPLTGLALLFGKKLVEAPTMRLRMAKYLDGVSDVKKAKIKAELEAGKVPEELYKLINPTPQTLQKSGNQGNSVGGFSSPKPTTPKTVRKELSPRK